MRSPSEVRFVKVGRGRLALTHRPRTADFANLRKLGCTHVVTLLKESEGAERLGDLARQAGLQWIWLPIPNGNHPEGQVHEQLMEALPDLSRLLDEGSSLLIHCSAGIHRTGTVAYGLLRWRGLSRSQTMRTISKTRLETAEGVGEKRLRWGDQIARPGHKGTSWIDSIRTSIARFWMKTFSRP